MVYAWRRLGMLALVILAALLLMARLKYHLLD